jgi:hypothetical protein
MYNKTYKIKKAFLIALAVDVMLLMLLLLLSMIFKSPASEKIVVIIMTIAAIFVFVEALSRKILTGNHGILIIKFFRNRELQWEDITHAGLLVLRKKVYLLLTTTKGFYILSNSYQDFQAFLRETTDHIEKEKIETDVLNQIESPMNATADIIKVWLGAAVLVAIILLKLINS